MISVKKRKIVILLSNTKAKYGWKINWLGVQLFGNLETHTFRYGFNWEEKNRKLMIDILCLILSLPEKPRKKKKDQNNNWFLLP